MKKTFKIKYVYFTVLLIIIAIPSFSLAQEEKEAIKLEQITVTAPGKKEGVTITPQSTIINVKEYKTPGAPQNIVDILKDRAIIDFRGQSDLIPGGSSPIYMRGFDSHRFTTSMDGLTIDYGRSASHGTRSMVVDYATLPLGQIENIEIMPGPHSALYGGKSVGGVINLKTKTPERYTTLKPDFRVTTSYRSYNTQNHSVNADGGAGPFVYGLSYQYNHTNGYLRNNRAEIDNYFMRLGYILPSDGYISFDAAYTDKDRELTVKNAPGYVDYHNNYPKTSTASKWPWQKPKRHEEYSTYRLHYNQPTPIGLFTIGGYYRRDRSEMRYFKKKDSTKTPEVKPDEIEGYSSVSKMRQAGGRIQNEIELFKDNTLTLGFDMVQMWQPGKNYKDYDYRRHTHKIADTKAGYLQDRWMIIPRLTLTAGLRYEDVSYWRDSNWDYKKNKYKITGEGDWIRRNRNQWIPKSFLTYELDDLANVLRDTSLSLGISKIWNPLPFCYG
ncbi:MAG: TonB-dependent receptor [Deltaproteobacteria bacterium]|nr:TonB-dependent receptor [Deltaproteobacteria bacterium]